LSRSGEHRLGSRRLDEMEDLFLLALIVTIAAVLLIAGLLYMHYIDGPPLPLSTE
jgi:hypothetical protein